MKKLIIVLVSFMFILFFASCITNNEIDEMKRIDEISNRYNLKTIKKDEIPKNIIPIKVENSFELEYLLKEISKTNLNKSNVRFELTNKLTTKGYTSYYTAKFSKKITKNNLNIANIYFNVMADLKIFKDGSFGEILSYSNERCSLTGWTLAAKLEYPKASVEISSDKQSATLRGSGTVNLYLLIQNLIKLYSYDVSVSGTYKINY
ncbi:hypothetical protein Marpi_1539 [Marinitoga piezophila KA3]|uniref:Lipoprotein n=1 Tax=Marinitoga piezophila (strain DSM 14283 / JCM 11233 / KA3) TaxID=443254 RepID=H2J4J1_MARPK|nr:MULTISPECIES: hypothetical protein [Marinitoga]AEX85933.1 hypothetical protein Marpi_1539 [Marinitoga piezophila KA3]